MERTITLSQIKQAIDEAYEANKSLKEGEVDEYYMAGVDADKFGISVVLADGTVINRGDTDISAPIGAISKVPLHTILLSQNTKEELAKKSGKCPMHRNNAKPEIGGSHGIRAVSAIEPTGDPDSKWDFIINRMIDMMGSAPTLDDKLYERMKADIVNEKQVEKLADAGYYLYDDAFQSIDMYRRAQSMKATAEQVAIMGATIVADGVNPVTKNIVFDGAISAPIVGLMAAKGPRKMTMPWNVVAGIPAKSSFGGLIMGVFPGVMSIAVYAPRLMPNRVSMKGAKAIISIMKKLDISVFQSAAIRIDTER